MCKKITGQRGVGSERRETGCIYGRVATLLTLVSGNGTSEGSCTRTCVRSELLREAQLAQQQRARVVVVQAEQCQHSNGKHRLHVPAIQVSLGITSKTLAECYSFTG